MVPVTLVRQPISPQAPSIASSLVASPAAVQATSLAPPVTADGEDRVRRTDAIVDRLRHEPTDSPGRHALVDALVETNARRRPVHRPSLPQPRHRPRRPRAGRAPRSHQGRPALRRRRRARLPLLRRADRAWRASPPLPRRGLDDPPAAAGPGPPGPHLARPARAGGTPAPLPATHRDRRPPRRGPRRGRGGPVGRRVLHPDVAGPPRRRGVVHAGRPDRQRGPGDRVDRGPDHPGSRRARAVGPRSSDRAPAVLRGADPAGDRRWPSA